AGQARRALLLNPLLVTGWWGSGCPASASSGGPWPPPAGEPHRPRPAGPAQRRAGHGAGAACRDVSAGGRAVSVLGGLQPQRDAVDAVPLVGGGRVSLTLEDMAQVRAAAGAAHLRAHHAVRAVLHQLHRVGVLRVVEGRPSAVRLELGLGGEQLGTAGAAGVDALGLGVGVLPREGGLGGRLAQYGVLGGGQLRAPLLVRLLHLVRHEPQPLLDCFGCFDRRSRIRGPRSVTSPAPMVRTRSPGPVIPATTNGTSAL